MLVSEEKALPRPRAPGDADAVAGGSGPRSKRARFDRCFSGLEFKMESGPLKELDPEKLKSEITRWAKAVVAYARQLSIGSSLERSDSRSNSQRGGGGGGGTS